MFVSITDDTKWMIKKYFTVFISLWFALLGGKIKCFGKIDFQSRQQKKYNKKDFFVLAKNVSDN